MRRLPTILVVLVFAGSLALALGASIVFARRLDRLGSRFGWPEAIVGLLTATAADAPELSSAVIAIAARKQRGRWSSAPTSSTSPRWSARSRSSHDRRSGSGGGSSCRRPAWRSL
ncbi:MAG: hypothetical protein ACRDQC_00175 [Gaiellales bacterium]